jgi:hypothetical protein
MKETRWALTSASWLQPGHQWLAWLLHHDDAIATIIQPHQALTANQAAGCNKMEMPRPFHNITGGATSLRSKHIAALMFPMHQVSPAPR